MAPKARSAKRRSTTSKGAARGRLRKSGRLRPKRREQGRRPGGADMLAIDLGAALPLFASPARQRWRATKTPGAQPASLHCLEPYPSRFVDVHVSPGFPACRMAVRSPWMHSRNSRPDCEHVGAAAAPASKQAQQKARRRSRSPPCFASRENKPGSLACFVLCGLAA
jgi:hypothetical protein